MIERFEGQPGQYSNMVKHGGVAYLAGLIATNWDGDITQQCQEIFAQIDDLLAKAGTDRSRLLTVQVFITDFAHYAAFKTAYQDWLSGENLPARATVRADLLDEKLLIEIMCTAATSRET